MKEQFFNGYSMIEVLTSVAVLSIIILPILYLFLQGYSYSCFSGMKTVAVNCGQEEMERLKARGFTDLKSELSGGFFMAPEVKCGLKDNCTSYYTLHLVCKEAGDNDERISVQLILIEVYVNWIDGVERELVLSSYLCDR